MKKSIIIALIILSVILLVIGGMAAKNWLGGNSEFSAAKHLLGLNAEFAAAKSMTLYDVTAPAGILSGEDLQKHIENAASLDVTKDLIKACKNASYHNEIVLRKGDKFALIKTDKDELIYLRISYYGDFFSIVGQSGYYTVLPKDKKLWEACFNSIPPK
ncbi:MAG: hypothetical protein LBS74_06570 [Oscillospiraceae bacterium]|nr:hypothetical protein [Oscillospiraceae bacterium]